MRKTHVYFCKTINGGFRFSAEFDAEGKENNETSPIWLLDDRLGVAYETPFDMSDAFFNPIDAACMVLSWWSQTYEPRIASLAPLPPDIGIKHVAELMESLVKIVPIADREAIQRRVFGPQASSQGRHAGAL